MKVGRPKVKKPLSGKIRITTVIESLKGMVLYTLPDGTGEYVIRLNAPFTDPRGKVLEGLEGWRLAFSTSTYCLFKNGDREAPFLVKDGKVTPLPSRAPRKTLPGK